MTLSPRTPGPDYERLVASLLTTLAPNHPGLTSLTIREGSKSRVAGASGYAHQVDVAILSDSDLFLFECKYWKRRIGVHAVLALAARKMDIQAALPQVRVWAGLVSTQEPTRGARKLAEHFAVSLDTVANPSEYSVRMGTFLSVGVVDGATLTDSEAVTERPETG